MQDETEKIIQDYILRAPEAIRSFMASGGWKNDAKIIANKFKLTEENTNNLKNEVVFVLIGMEPKKDFVENIKNELGIDKNLAEWITEDINRYIFNKVANEIDFMWRDIQNEEPEQSQNKLEPAPRTESGVGQSFEKIILNQTKAMREAVPANLPTEKSEPKKIHDYAEGNDPYREPIQ